MTEDQREAIEAYDALVASHTEAIPAWDDEERIQAALYEAYAELGFNAPWMEVEVFLGEAWEDHLDEVQHQWAEDHAPNH